MLITQKNAGSRKQNDDHWIEDIDWPVVSRHISLQGESPNVDATPIYLHTVHY